MKVLIATPACHGKNIGAVQKDIYGTIKLLKELGHTVALYTIKSHHRDASVLEWVSKEYGIPVRFFEPDPSLLLRLRDTLFRSPLFFDGASHVFGQMVRDRTFNDYVESYAPDAIISFISDSWPLIAWARAEGIHTVLRSHNFESSFLWEALSTAGKWNPINWFRCAVKYGAEKRAVCLAGAVGTLPFVQVSTYRKWKPKNIAVLTLTFLPESLRGAHLNSDKKKLDVFYLGANYSVIFHLRGAKKLIEEIAPQVLQNALNDFTFHICGAKLPDELVKKCIGNIVYEGYVPDLEAFLSKMDIGVFPVETGKTMKGKVFETLARAFPMIISPNCLGGYQLVDGKEVLVAHTTAQFAENILKLRDPEIRKKLAEGAHEFGRKNFGKEALLSVLAKLLSSSKIS